MCLAPSGVTTLWCGSASLAEAGLCETHIQKRLAIGEPFHYLSSFSPTYRHQFESN